MTKKEQTKNEAGNAQDKKPLTPVDNRYQELANLNYMTDANARQEIIDIIDEVRKIEGISLKKSSDHDLTILYEGKSLVRICPLKKDFSSSIGNSKIGKHSKSDILKAIIKGVEKRKEELENARIEAEKIAKKEAEEKAKAEAEEKAKQEASKKTITQKKGK